MSRPWAVIFKLMTASRDRVGLVLLAPTTQVSKRKTTPFVTADSLLSLCPIWSFPLGPLYRLFWSVWAFRSCWRRLLRGQLLLKELDFRFFSGSKIQIQKLIMLIILSSDDADDLSSGAVAVTVIDMDVHVQRWHSNNADLILCSLTSSWLSHREAHFL